MTFTELTNYKAEGYYEGDRAFFTAAHVFLMGVNPMLQKQDVLHALDRAMGEDNHYPSAEEVTAYMQEAVRDGTAFLGQ